VSDDRHPGDIIEEGHMDHIIRRAIEEGVDPIKAIQMATINTAEHFNVDFDIGAIAPSKLADIVVLNDLRKINVDMVFVSGKLVAKEGKLLEEVRVFNYPSFTRKTVKLKEKLTPEKFKIYVGKEKSKVRINVMKVIKASVLTKRLVLEVPVKEGYIEQSVEMDLLKVTSIERHKASGEIGLGFVTGFGFKSGAVASTVAHDNHNLLAVGTNDEDIAFACNKLEEVGGGMIAVDKGEILAIVKLPIAGLISDEPIEKVSEDVKKLQEAWKTLGCNLIHPFMTMSLLSLSVLPELRVTNKGLIDTINFRKISLVET
jgi:adenine deaminase